jgi:excisionase family DNA binding protein
LTNHNSWVIFVLNLIERGLGKRMKLLTTKEAGEILGVNASRVRQLILSGRLPATKLGRDLFIKEKDLKKVAVRKPGRPKQKGGKG